MFLFLHSLVILVAMSSSIRSYFERKKRDLSDKSANEEERKKAKRAVWICHSAKKQVMTLMYLPKE